MKNRIAALAAGVALVCTITACGGGDGGNSSSATPMAHSTPQVIDIDMYGDSTMAGVTMVGAEYVTTANNEPNNVQQELGSRARIFNQGVSGTTLQELIDGTDGRHTMNLQQLMANSSSRIVVENFAINDASSQSLQQFMSNVDYFVTQARANGKVPVIEEPNPVCDQNLKNIPELDAQVAALEEYAARYNVAIVKQYDYIKSLPDWQSMLPDRIHPNEALYKIKADRTAAALLQILQTMPR
ncbi:SGNH/GDSL hydrolase family protein [Burkholderia ubonensis]|nr:SGNH/GDSL hydrolase family protein [Burkholderia ubonensis]